MILFTWVFYVGYLMPNPLYTYKENMALNNQHKTYICIYICIWFGLLGFYGISNIVGYVMPNPLYISSSSCRAGSTDIPDPLSPLFPIVHRLIYIYELFCPEKLKSGIIRSGQIASNSRALIPKFWRCQELSLHC